MIADVGVGFDIVTSGTVWSLFLTVVIIGIGTNNKIYAVLGVLSSVVIIAALAASYTYGKVIDRHRGGELLRATAIANSLIHVVRPFVQSVVVVGGVNVANESVATGYAMAFTRGMFDTADFSGYRITYLATMEIMSNLGGAIAAATLFVLAYYFGETEGMKLHFFVAAVVVLLIATPKFRLYQK